MEQDDMGPQLPPPTQGEDSEEEGAVRAVDVASMCCRHCCCTAFEEQPELMQKRERWLTKLREQGANKDKYVFSLLQTLRASEAPGVGFGRIALRKIYPNCPCNS